MVRDVRDHTFSSLDCLWSLRKGLIEILGSMSELDSNVLWAVVRARTWSYLSV